MRSTRIRPTSVPRDLDPLLLRAYGGRDDADGEVAAVTDGAAEPAAAAAAPVNVTTLTLSRIPVGTSGGTIIHGAADGVLETTVTERAMVLLSTSPAGRSRGRRS